MQEITKTKETAPFAIPAYIWIVLAFFSVFVYFFGLTIPFLGPDEARYAQVAREMMDRGDLITPTLGGFNWFEKPVLLYWLEIAAFKIFGVSEFAARFGPALFGLGTIVSLWLLGRSVERGSDRTATSSTRLLNDFANYLAVIAASTIGIIVFSRGASFDIIVTFPLTAAMVSFFIADRAERKRDSATLPLTLFYVFVGIALLAKGLIGVLFPFAIVFFYFLLSWRLPSRRFLISLVWGTVISLGIAAIWYVPMYQRHGYDFINQFFIQHHFQRFTSNKYQHPQPFYFFLWVLPLMTLPWMPLFLAGIWKYVTTTYRRISDQGVESSDSGNDSKHHLLIYAIAWLIVPLTFFSISGSKLPGYVLPAVPAAVLIATIFGIDLIIKARVWQWVIISIAASVLAGVIILLIFVVPQFAETDSVKGLIADANEKGYGSSKVLMLHNISHNAEFYAAGRLVRGVDGSQTRFNGVDDIQKMIELEGGESVLVLVPLEYVKQLTNDRRIKTEILGDNAELAIAAVSKN